jgi:tRNA A-37 threonylcarbamoyl transferase component Bud32/tetratricopeptide (TPR) repeat protein
MSHADAPFAAKCRRCGSALSTKGLAGICLRCLALDSVLGEESLITGSEPMIGFNTGRSIGDYELLEEVGRGGMGVVFKARQKRLERLVAVKVLRAGWLARAGELARFRSEAKMVAGLQHPNIVAVHEVGEHDGQPYFSMDFVAGRTLEEIAGGHPLPPGRAARFVKQIAEAIHYAHERGVLHRDLKPSNVLVDGDDNPRVTDFGLAKRMEGDANLTMSGQVLGSPNFMPPEQASGRGEIGVASDIYSMGALLYHLLTGRPPFLSETITETLRQVVENEPASPRLLVPTVPQDLETICFKCLQKEPHRRYESAQVLAEELGRFLRDEPIQARPARPAEKLWRWCRRNRALAASGGIVVALVLTVAIGSPIAAFRINRERQAAATEANKSRQVAAFLTSMLESVQPEVANGRDTALLRAMLAQTSRRLDTEFARLPEVEAQLRMVLAQVYLSLQLGEEGAKHARIAVSLRQKSLGEMHPEVIDAKLLLAALLENSHNWLDAKELASDMVQHCRRVYGNHDPRTCSALHVLGNALKRGRQYPGAIAALREVAEIERALPGIDRHAHFATVEALGVALVEGGQPAEAAVVFDAWLREAPQDALTNSVDAAFAKGWLGTALQRQGKFEQSDSLQRESLEMKRRLLPADHPGIAWHLFYWAQAFEAREKFAEVQPLLSEAWSIAELHPADALHLKHVLAFYGLKWMQTSAKKEPSAAADAATWQNRLTELERQHPELKGEP